MKALTIRQPWAWAIVTGLKSIENRSWPTRYRGLLLVHAGRQPWSGAYDMPECPALKSLPYGAIVGGVDVVDCVPVEQVAGDRFASGPWCWKLANAWLIEKPVPMLGKLGMFDVPAEIIEALQNRERLQAAAVR